MQTRDTAGPKRSNGSEALHRLQHEIEAIAPLESTVLLSGETGTGKTRAARMIHERSARARSPFVHVDCAALSGGLIESELFGHERGAFTGAEQRHIGRFERAGRGTIFLDEIGDLAPELQAKLLRVLEDREYERVGGRQTLRMRARIIAASNRNLFPANTHGAFRTDLYFRLSVFQVEIPPLRERVEDLPDLVQDALDRVCALHAISRPEISDAFVSRLAQHDWPGNVRELLNTLERVLALHGSGPLLASEIEPALANLGSPRLGIPRASASAGSQSLRQEVAELERREIREALDHSRGNVAGAARRLCMPRGTLRHKIRKHSLGDTGEDSAY